MILIHQELKEKGLKVTPQRIAIYNAVAHCHNHPTAEYVVDIIKKDYPNISVGTVYKVLNVFVENNLLKKVKSEKDVMRYDAMLDHHHHLYCADTDRIEDYKDPELDALVQAYFKKKKIKNFKIENFKLQITGKFNK
ncbi:MAG: transcriptional repressor [Bacteroidia bacterium]|nr:transcriptional repressor [Bacteroidia bacterium]